MGVKRVGVGGGVRARDASDVGLVDGDDFVEILEAFDRVVFAGLVGGAVEAGVGGSVEDVEDQRGFAGAGNTRHRHQNPERDAHRQVFQVVLARAVNGQVLLPIGNRAVYGGKRSFYRRERLR